MGYWMCRVAIGASLQLNICALFVLHTTFVVVIVVDTVAVAVVVVDGQCLYAHNDDTRFMCDYCLILAWPVGARGVCGETNCYGVHFVSIYMLYAPVCLVCKYCSFVLYLYRLNSYRVASRMVKGKRTLSEMHRVAVR